MIDLSTLLYHMFLEDLLLRGVQPEWVSSYIGVFLQLWLSTHHFLMRMWELPYMTSLWP